MSNNFEDKRLKQDTVERKKEAEKSYVGIIIAMIVILIGIGFGVYYYTQPAVVEGMPENNAPQQNTSTENAAVQPAPEATPPISQPITEPTTQPATQPATQPNPSTENTNNSDSNTSQSSQ